MQIADEDDLKAELTTQHTPGGLAGHMNMGLFEPVELSHAEGK